MMIPRASRSHRPDGNGRNHGNGSRAARARSSAPMRATIVKRAHGSGPVASVLPSGWPDCSSGSSSQLPGLPPCGRSQAGAPGAAKRRGRTSLTPASGGRSSRGGEDRCAVGLPGVACWFPARGWRSGLASTHSASARLAARCHDHVSGTGLLSHVIERLPACSCRWSERARGLAACRCHGRRGGVLVSVACISASRCQERVSSLRAIAMVAVFFPRRLAIAV